MIPAVTQTLLLYQYLEYVCYLVSGQVNLGTQTQSSSPHLRSDHEWSLPSCCPGFHYCPVVDQHLDQRHAAALGSTVQGGVAKLGLHRLCVHVRQTIINEREERCLF